MAFSKNVLLILIFLIPIISTAQSEKEIPKNEFGTDIIYLVQQVFNFNQGEFYRPYSPAYSVTYKRHFKKITTRIAIGGSSSSTEIDNDLNADELRNVSQQLNYRVGVEKSMAIHKKWNFYYGIDFKHSTSKNRNDGNYSNGDFRYGYERTSSSLGLSPFFGIEFKINDKMSLQTEANFIAYLSNSTNNQLITPVVQNPSTPTPLPRLEDNSGFGTAFNVPNFLVFAIKL